MLAANVIAFLSALQRERMWIAPVRGTPTDASRQRMLAVDLLTLVLVGAVADVPSAALAAAVDS